MVPSDRYMSMDDSVVSPSRWLTPTVGMILRWSALVLAVAEPARAQIPIHGRVVSATGNPIDHADVTLLADSTLDAVVLSKVNTDASGAFTVIAPSAGRFSLLARRTGYAVARRTLDVPTSSKDSLLIRLGGYWSFRQGVDSLARLQHWKRAAAARERTRHWVCGDSREATRAAAETAYTRFAMESGMRHFLADYAMPDDRGAFRHEFTRPLSNEECATFAEGLDRSDGLESDYVRVFRFGNALILPDWGDGGAFADWKGRVLAIFIVPS